MPGLTLSDLPTELVSDNLLPFLNLRDSLALGAINKSFSTLIENHTFWKARLEADFSFPGAQIARIYGWKAIYKGLSNPKAYVWGDRGQYRLGLTQTSNVLPGSVLYPIRLHIPGVRFVNIIAGGWSFHALDAKGDIYVWGTLGGSMRAFRRNGFSDPRTPAETPTKLQMPVQFSSISCGRLHSIALDSEGCVWNFLNWGRPYRLVSPFLDRSIFNSTPIQVESGWTFSSVLTGSGDVYVWFPLEGRLSQQIRRHTDKMDSEGNKMASLKDGVIPCVTWDLEHEVHMLSALPALPKIGARIYNEADVKLIKIAAMEESLIGLTNQGHVLKFDGLRSEVYTPHSVWTYLPFFSDSTKIRDHLSIYTKLDEERDERHIRITHISAHFRTFVAYSVKKTSIVLIGMNDAEAETGPKIIPSLQNRGIISVVIGYYHNGALTDDGKLLTWGGFSNGALGLGSLQDLPIERTEAQGNAWGPPEVKTPTEVRFDHNAKRTRNKFCFSAAAAGWHMGALVCDLDGEDDEEEIPTHLSYPEPPPTRPPH